jgi:hypothetical protein
MGMPYRLSIFSLVLSTFPIAEGQIKSLMHEV